MVSRILGIILIMVGIAGLLLPVVPGMLLIAIGIMLLFNKRDNLDKKDCGQK